MKARYGGGDIRRPVAHPPQAPQLFRGRRPGADPGARGRAAPSQPARRVQDADRAGTAGRPPAGRAEPRGHPADRGGRAVPALRGRRDPGARLRRRRADRGRAAALPDRARRRAADGRGRAARAGDRPAAGAPPARGGAGADGAQPGADGGAAGGRGRLRGRPDRGARDDGGRLVRAALRRVAGRGHPAGAPAGGAGAGRPLGLAALAAQLPAGHTRAPAPPPGTTSRGCSRRRGSRCRPAGPRRSRCRSRGR